MSHELSYVLDRAATLKAMNQQSLTERARIRAIMNGGVEGIYAVMAWNLGKGASMSHSDIAGTYGVDSAYGEPSRFRP